MFIPAALSIFKLELKLGNESIIRYIFINKINKNTLNLFLLKGGYFFKLNFFKLNIGKSNFQ